MPLPPSSSSRPLLNSLKTNKATRSIHVHHLSRHPRTLPAPSALTPTTNSITHPLPASQVRPLTSSATFAISPIPCKSVTGGGKCIRTAAALIIGDEILNGKTHDRNSNYFAKYCFENGIKLKRVEVVADNEEEIIEASRRMVRDYDFVITSGGIGPTHDDITYAALAKAFGQGLVHHAETIRRMDQMYQHRPWVNSQNSQQQEAFRRMALFPEHAEVIFVGRDIWVPVVRLEGKLCVFPGIPALFQKMLDGLKPFLPLPPTDERPLRIQVFTDRPESIIAPYLTSLQARLKPCGVQVGSYPVIGQGVFVSLIGRENGPIGKDNNGREVHLRDIAQEVELEISGQVVTEEEVAQKKEEARVRATRNPSMMAAAQVGAGIGVSIAAQTHQQPQHHQARSL